MKIDFSGEAHDTEWRLLSSLLGYNVEVEYELGTGEVDTADVRILRLATGEEGIELVVRMIDEDGEPTGEELAVAPSRMYVH